MLVAKDESLDEIDKASPDSTGRPDFNAEDAFGVVVGRPRSSPIWCLIACVLGGAS